MVDTTRSGVIVAALALLLVFAVAWDALVGHRRAAPPSAVAPAAPDESVRVSGPRPPPAAVASTTATQGNTADTSGTGGPSYIEQLAHSETRRRIRASAGVTYLNEIVAESQDSSLHRWVNRIADPVRVRIAPGTVANFRPEFLDAIRAAFGDWEQVGVPVRFALDADTTHAEVNFKWKIQFDIERTGQTDLTWDQDGHLLSATVTLATFDPKGQPLAADDIHAIALHEIGHVLGLDHSPDSTDLMFAKGAVRRISDRDLRTVLLLYQLTPGNLR